jgi:primosomal protein N' (replication factor Y)
MSRPVTLAEPDPAAEHLPIASVYVDIPLAHLDRTFDYRVPEPMSAQAVAGARVRVRFAGRLVDGFIAQRSDTTEHVGRLAALHRVVSAEPVLAPDILRAARLVADRYAGTVSDVLRLAVPPRHAAVEKAMAMENATSVEAATEQGPAPPAAPDGSGAWGDYRDGPGFLAALASGQAARAVWTALPATDWPQAIAHAAAMTLSAGRGVVVVAPDNRDTARLDAAFTSMLGPEHHTVLRADLGPRERYRRFLAVRRGRVRAVIGTRSAMFAPVTDLGLAVIWDDGDDLHAERRAPYPHAREVLALRAHSTGAGFLAAAHARSCEAAVLVDTGWARSLTADRATVRRLAPRVTVTGGGSGADDDLERHARLPTQAWQIAKTALADGAVLVQVPRGGYLASLACAACRTRAICASCHGPLRLTSGHAVASCGWCGRIAADWACPSCGSTRFRALTVGSARTAVEIGQAFPGVRVIASGGDQVVEQVDGAPAIVVATPGAEPVAAGGYRAALLLDAWALLDRLDLRASEEAFRRWTGAAALVRPATAGGAVVLVGDPAASAIQALVRWDATGFAERELAERRALHFPPAVCMVELVGSPSSVADLLSVAELPPQTETLGPEPVEAGRGSLEGPGASVDDRADQVRALLRCPRHDAAALSGALKAAQAVRSARKAPDFGTVRVDPVVVG